MKTKCATKNCRKAPSKGRKVCETCRSRANRKKNAIKYCYDTLKSNSIRRGKEFTLTLEQFTNFCYQTDYIRGKGKTAQSFSIDRRENSKGYTIDNIRILTVSENSRKGAKILNYDWYTKHATVMKSGFDYSLEQMEDLPF